MKEKRLEKVKKRDRKRPRQDKNQIKSKTSGGMTRSRNAEQERGKMKTSKDNAREDNTRQRH
jgi:hypothetical protein